MDAVAVTDPPKLAAELVREVAIGGLAGALSGILVVGLGGRLMMRIASSIDPSATGLVTSNGNRIGEVTVGGTLGFILFFGVLFGAYAAVLWAAVSPWIPGHGIGRALATGVVATSVATFFVIRGDEPDFGLLERPAVSIALIVGIVGLLGVTLALADDMMRRRLPPGSDSRWGRLYVAIVGLGVLVSPIAIGAYFLTGERTSFRPPADVGAALLVVGIATVVWWVMRVRWGHKRPHAALTVLARAALATAVLLGLMRLSAEVSVIVGV